MKDFVIRPPTHTPVFIILGAIFTILLTAIIIQLSISLYTGMHPITQDSVITVIFGALATIGFAVYVIRLPRKPPGTVEIPLHNIIFDNFHYNQSLHYPELITNGRKTIATIASVEYIPAEDLLIELGLEISRGQTSEPNPGCSLIYHGVPRFRIQYRFNPPDDQKAEDLVHEVLFYGEPGESLKPGAPLPILYRIYQNAGLEHVDSMPFPLPRDQVIDMTHVMYLDS